MTNVPTTTSLPPGQANGLAVLLDADCDRSLDALPPPIAAWTTGTSSYNAWCPMQAARGRLGVPARIALSSVIVPSQSIGSVSTR